MNKDKTKTRPYIIQKTNTNATIDTETKARTRTKVSTSRYIDRTRNALVLGSVLPPITPLRYEELDGSFVKMILLFTESGSTNSFI